jgi:peptidoglycan-associated lipoprotein
MKLLKRFVLTTITFTLFMSTAIAQPKAVRNADKSFNQGEYYEALEGYKKALSGIKGNKALKAELTYKSAMCYKMFNDTKKAEVWFNKAIKAKYPEPEAILFYGDMLRSNNKYDEALTEYENYVKLKPDDKRGNIGIESCKLAIKWKQEPTRHTVNNVQQLNSKNDDFSIIYSKKNYKEVIFTSAREGTIGNAVDGWTGQSFTDLFEAKQDKNGKWSTPEPFKEPLNSKHNEGSADLNKKFSTIYFTRCEYGKNKVKGCQIFNTRRKGNNWDEPTLMPFADDTFTVGHPAINLNEDLLIFASDMPGGFGGRDLWYATYDKKKKTWSNPINLGAAINTAGDELFPTLRNDSTLYFSSNGMVGMGGLDIYKATLNGGKWGNVENMKFPLNSPGDDFGMVFQGDEEKGFLTSNRDGGKGGDDIYEFSVPPILFNISGIVYDFDTKDPIKDAEVQMVDKDGITYSIMTDKMGAYYFDNSKFKENNTYNFTAHHDDFLNDIGTVTTVGETEGKDFKKDFFLKSAKVVIRLPEILYDLNSAQLRPESKDSLNGLIKTLRDNPNIRIELMSHTDSRGSAKSNIDLSQRRAQSVVDYLIEQKIDPSRLQAKGYGETRLLNRCKDGVTCSEEEHQRNRRTEFRIIATDFVPAEGSVEYKAPQIKLVDEDEEIQTEVEEIKRDNIDLDKIENKPKETPKKN